jgi:disulfide bond formation protein DsbB
MKLFFAMGAIVANLLTVGIIVVGVVGRDKDESPFEFLRGMTLWLASAVAIAAMFGSLYLSDIVHLIPCKFCWYQRIAMYPLAVILPIAAWRRDDGIRLYAIVIAVIGLGLSIWHRLMQAFPSLDSGSCAAVGPLCSGAYIKEFGFVTIPYMAASSFLLILALLWANRVNSQRAIPTPSQHIQ